MSLATAYTALFVPGDRPDRFQKAVASGADAVIIDLEDSVSADHKASARQNASLALTEDSAFRAAVRVNSLAGGGREDIAMLSAITDPSRLTALMIPKAEDARLLTDIADQLPEVPLVPLVETVQGLAAAESLGRVRGVVRLAFGAIDFGVDADATSELLLDHARCELVLASRLAGVSGPLDSPNPEFRDLEHVRSRAVASRGMGFSGGLCIHPTQVDAVAASFRPAPAEIAWAKDVLAVSSGNVTQLDGRMIDRPVYLRARAILGCTGGLPSRSGRNDVQAVLDEWVDAADGRGNADFVTD